MKDQKICKKNQKAYQLRIFFLLKPIMYVIYINISNSRTMGYGKNHHLPNNDMNM